MTGESGALMTSEGHSAQELEHPLSIPSFISSNKI